MSSWIATVGALLKSRAMKQQLDEVAKSRKVRDASVNRGPKATMVAKALRNKRSPGPATRPSYPPIMRRPGGGRRGGGGFN